MPFAKIQLCGLLVSRTCHWNSQLILFIIYLFFFSVKGSSKPTVLAVYDNHKWSYILQDKHCYSRVLELLINVWAYHSARRMVYVDPETGLMQEQHKLNSRRGKMWVKWFAYTTLKSMDEDLAEEADSDRPKRRWLWPSTGEVYWQGVFEKERNLRNQQKEKRKQHSRVKQTRMRSKRRQKVIGKYVKPPPDDIESSNSTIFTS